MKKMMMLTGAIFAFASCQKEEIQPSVEPLNDPNSVSTAQYEELGAGHSIIDLEKGDGQNHTVYVYHFFDTDEVSGELIIEKSNGSEVLFPFEPKHITKVYLENEQISVFYLKRSVDLSYEELHALNGWFNTTLQLDQNTGLIQNVNFFNGEMANRTNIPTYCGLEPVTSVNQTNLLSTSFWVDFSKLPIVSNAEMTAE